MPKRSQAGCEHGLLLMLEREREKVVGVCMIWALLSSGCCCFLHCQGQRTVGTQVFLAWLCWWRKWECRRVGALSHFFMIADFHHLQSECYNSLLPTPALLLPCGPFSELSGCESLPDALAATSPGTQCGWMSPCSCKCWIICLRYLFPT
jgi:hypothetical protein